MDSVNNGRRRRGSTLLGKVSESGESRKRCKFCRGFFTPNPNQARHDFCRDECRKNFHKYGALPLAKLKADLTREFSRLIAAEIAPLRARLDGLDAIALSMGWRVIAGGDAKRGGGAAA